MNDKQLDDLLSSNPLYYNLPSDYATLTSEGKRLARMWGLVNWGFTNVDSYIRAWRLWRTYYIEGWAGNSETFTAPTPKVVEEMVRLAANRYAAFMGYRGIAKTTHISKILVLFETITRYQYSTAIICASKNIGASILDWHIIQLRENSRIINDFGEIKPRKGRFNTENNWIQPIMVRTPDGKWWACGDSHILNRSWESGIRGMSPRPDRIVLDDPENDEKMRNPRLVQQFEDKFVRVVLPAVAADAKKRNKIARIIWPGTFVDVVVPSVLRRIVQHMDPRYYQWKVAEFPVYKDVGRQRIYTWPELHGREFCDMRRRVMGALAFEAEYLGRSVARATKLFRFDSEQLLFRMYRESDKIFVLPNPYETNSIELRAFLKPMHRYVIVDPSLGLSTDTAILAIAVDYEGHYWVLGGYSTRVGPDATVPLLIGLAQQIGAQRICIEDYAFQRYFASHVNDIINRMKDSWPAGLPLPHVVGVRSVLNEKQERISSILQYPINMNLTRIAMPTKDVLGDPKAIRRLLELIEAWTYEGLHSGIEIDIIDCLAIAVEAIGERRPAPPSQLPTYDEIFEDQIEREARRRIMQLCCPTINAIDGKIIGGKKFRRRPYVRTVSLSQIRRSIYPVRTLKKPVTLTVPGKRLL